MVGVTSISWAKGFTSPFMNSTCHYGRVWWDQLITVNKPHHWCQSLPGQSHIHWKKKNYLKPAAEKPPSDSRRIHLLILKQWNKQPDTVGFGKKNFSWRCFKINRWTHAANQNQETARWTQPHPKYCPLFPVSRSSSNSHILGKKTNSQCLQLNAHQHVRC